MTAKLPALASMLFAAAALPACLPARVIVLPSGTGTSAVAPKAPDCRIDFSRTDVARPHEEIAALHVEGSSWAGPEDLQEAMRARACELGADAVLVTREYLATMVGNIEHRTMNGAALRYLDRAPAPVPPR